jgi:hypothetical protein
MMDDKCGAVGGMLGENVPKQVLFLHIVQIGSGAHPVYSPIRIGSFFP